MSLFGRPHGHLTAFLSPERATQANSSDLSVLRSVELKRITPDRRAVADVPGRSVHLNHCTIVTPTMKRHAHGQKAPRIAAQRQRLERLPPSNASAFTQVVQDVVNNQRAAGAKAQKRYHLPARMQYSAVTPLVTRPSGAAWPVSVNCLLPLGDRRAHQKTAGVSRGTKTV